MSDRLQFVADLLRRRRWYDDDKLKFVGHLFGVPRLNYSCTQVPGGEAIFVRQYDE